MANELFDNAKRNKKDEFYTPIGYIELELRNYRDQFKGKTILCNCDDPYESNFFKYFAMNFNQLGLKKLISTCYAGSPVAGTDLDLEDIKPLNYPADSPRKPYKVEITEVVDANNDGAIDLSDVEHLLKNKKNTLTLLEGDGDFRSDECIELLQEADIAISNPPFSLFREYLQLLEKHNKKYLIIGNTNALTYKDVFSLIKRNKLRTGYTNFNVGMYFYVPDDWESYHKIEDGRKMVRVSTSCWLTNLNVTKHNEFITLYKQYSPKEYPHYENYNAINCDKVADIPYDYDGYIGVPITFIDKYNPKQFKIVALGIVGSIDFTSERRMEILEKGRPTGRYTVNAKGTLYKKYNPEKDKKLPAFKDDETGELYSSIYARVIIKRKEMKK